MSECVFTNTDSAAKQQRMRERAQTNALLALCPLRVLPWIIFLHQSTAIKRSHAAAAARRTSFKGALALMTQNLCGSRAARSR
jgi:hypothetical protein